MRAGEFPGDRISPAGMVKELDVFEFNHGCGLKSLSRGNIRNRRNTRLHGHELTCNVFPMPVGAEGPSPIVSARSSILTLPVCAVVQPGAEQDGASLRERS